jgi:hypothetical protein
MDLDGDVVFDVYIPHEELYGDEYNEVIYFLDRRWNEWFALGATDLLAEMRINIVFDEEAGQVTSAEIVSTEPLEEWWKKLRVG